MANNEEARVKLTNTQLNKLKFAAKIKTEKTPRITKKISQYEEFHHEILLTTRQKTKINAFPYNMQTDIKLSKSQ